MAEGQRVYPTTSGGTAPLLTIAPSYKDPNTGALYLFNGDGYSQVAEPWNEELHIGPIEANEAFGDVESWAAYLNRHTKDGLDPFITWNSKGLRAVLDYHEAGLPGRCQWIARHPFQLAPAFAAWMLLADNKPREQRFVVEWLEGHLADIVEPPAGQLIQTLRSLRTSVTKASGVTLNDDATALIEYTGSTSASGRGGTVSIPTLLTIDVQVLKGHVEPAVEQDTGEVRVDQNGQAIMQPVVYRLTVNQRVAVDNDGAAKFRYEIPLAERTLEGVYADRVRAAKSLLGAFEVLRAGES